MCLYQTANCQFIIFFIWKKDYSVNGDLLPSMGAIWNTGEIGTKLSLLHLILLCESYYMIMLIPSIAVQSTIPTCERHLHCYMLFKMPQLFPLSFNQLFQHKEGSNSFHTEVILQVNIQCSYEFF